jgi:ABC-2 type transport system ATP-binding protein
MSSERDLTSDYVIEARGLSKHFGTLVAVDNLDLRVPRGQIYGFLGPNGSGKSTTIRMLCGLLTPTAGSATVLGTEVPGDAQALKARIGYMTQKFSLFGDMSNEENLQFIAAIYSYPRAERKARIDELLEQYDLADRRRQLAGTMSGGQKQRLALACAVLHKPDLLLLDEPTSAVDPQSRRDFWAKLFSLAESGTTLLVSTHYMDEAERCHRLAILDHGVKVADGTPEQLKAGTGMHVVEVYASDSFAAQKAIADIPGVASVTQLGIRLRILMPNRITDPVERVQRRLEERAIDAKTTLSAPGLEDVFVAVTMKPDRSAA